MLRRLVILWLLVFSSSVQAQEGMTQTQTTVLRQVMSVGGSINEEMHRKFWTDVPKEATGQWNTIFLWLAESITLAQDCLRALWRSALISFEKAEVLHTKALEDCEKATEAHALESFPFVKGSPEYDAFLKTYLPTKAMADEHASRLLEAAAKHTDLVSMNGEVIRIDDAIIKTVLDGLDESFQRVELLMNPVWANP